MTTTRRTPRSTATPTLPHPRIPSKAWTATPNTKSASGHATLPTVSTTLTGAGGSTAVSYTDTEAEAGQTYTYAVEARNAAGLSPLSNTRTATVPQNEEEEEPIALRQQTVTTLVTNLDNASESTGLLLASRRVATSFTTDDAALSHNLTSLQLRAGKARVGDASAIPIVAVHRDNGGQPGDLLYTLDKPDDFLSVDDTTYRTYTFSAPEGAVLRAGETYWVVYNTQSGKYSLDTTDETSQTGDGWMIGDTALRESADLSTWETTATGPLKFAVIGTKVSSLLEEEPDVDLPGGAHDCHLTDRIVLAGHTSSGHLTAGVDTSSGLTGDCFRLETQWGKQYRVEVKFGDTESVDIGGSAWIVYTGSDFSGMSSLGSAVDHNREDGRTFTDFKHNNSNVKSYFVDVAAYDLYSAPYSSNSLTYNGPYTITMKDITGVAMMVSNRHPGTTTAASAEFPLTSGTDTATDVDLGITFQVGPHSSGYRLDRVRVPFHNLAEAGASPAISIHQNNSSNQPGAGEL